MFGQFLFETNRFVELMVSPIDRMTLFIIKIFFNKLLNPLILLGPFFNRGEIVHSGQYFRHRSIFDISQYLRFSGLFISCEHHFILVFGT